MITKLRQLFLTFVLFCLDRSKTKAETSQSITSFSGRQWVSKKSSEKRIRNSSSMSDVQRRFWILKIWRPRFLAPQNKYRELRFALQLMRKKSLSKLKMLLRTVSLFILLYYLNRYTIKWNKKIMGCSFNSDLEKKVFWTSVLKETVSLLAKLLYHQTKLENYELLFEQWLIKKVCQSVLQM